MNRRDFLKLFGGVAVAGAVPAVLERQGQDVRREDRVVHKPRVYVEMPPPHGTEAAIDPHILDKYGEIYAVYRMHGETDHAFRQRLLAKITKA